MFGESLILNFRNLPLYVYSFTNSKTVNVYKENKFALYANAGTDMAKSKCCGYAFSLL